MLKQNFKYNHVVLVGSSSELALTLIYMLPVNVMSKLTLVGRNLPDLSHLNSRHKIEFLPLDISDSKKLGEFLGNIKNMEEIDLVILSAAILPAEFNEFDYASFQNFFQVNTISNIILLSAFARQLASQKFGTIVVFSSVAAIRPRRRNFTYGSSKIALDFYAQGLSQRVQNENVNILIVRPGFVFTKMTKDMSPAPFAVRPEVAARKILQKINRVGVIYVPSKLKFIMSVIYHLPKSVFNILDQ
jgi:decaprenylphospho-beta-D-erythro-pentofuranosid-2-ulose 2-reductase